jgi:hypothetical protein
MPRILGANKAQPRNKSEIWRRCRITKHVVTAASQSIVCCRRCAVLCAVRPDGCLVVRPRRLGEDQLARCRTLQRERGEGSARKIGGESPALLITAAMTIAEADENGGIDRAPIQLPQAEVLRQARRSAVQGRRVMLRGEGVRNSASGFSAQIDASVPRKMLATFGRIDGGMFCCNVPCGVVVGERRQVVASPTHSCATQMVPSMRPRATGRSACYFLPKTGRRAAHLVRGVFARGLTIGVV